MTRLPLRIRIVFMTSVLLVAMLGGVLVTLAFIMKSEIASAARQAGNRESSVLQQAITSRGLALSRETTLLADRPGTKNVYLADVASIQDHLNEVKHQIGADWLMMSDPTGKVQAVSDGHFKTGTSLANRFGIQQGMDSKQWSGLDRDSSGLVLSATSPIRIGEYVQAVLTSAIQIDSEFIQSLCNPKQTQLALFDGEQLVASSFPGARIQDREVQAVSIADQDWVGTTNVLKTDGGLRKLRLLTLVPKSSVTAPYEALWQALLLTFVLTLSLGVLSGFRFAASISTPIEELTEAAKIIEQGDWPQPFQTQRPDELGLLQRVFDSMTSTMRSSQERLLAMLNLDPLTDLLNHRAFREQLANALERPSEDHPNLSLVLIDLDNFEEFNQAHGVDQGDQVLIEVGEIVRGSAMPLYPAGRYGGNEFAFIITDPNVESIADDIRTRIESATELTASVGIAHLQASTTKPDLLILAAEMAVEQAKLAGRNRVRVFDSFPLSGSESELREVLQPSSYAAVKALAEAVDAKDEYTRGHSQRVADYAKALAETMGYDAGFISLVYMTGTLHDVGKIGVPDAVLKKPDRLTDEEFELIKLHPVLGEKIVSQIPQLRDTLPGIRHHHERFDGRGYPDNLTGDSIPLIARILAVADTYDAMASDRPYRKGLPIEVAIAEIRKGAGTQFDPKLAMAFAELFEQRAAA